MKNEEKDLRPRTKMFARRIIRLYGSLSKTDAVALAAEANELVAIFIPILKKARGHE